MIKKLLLKYKWYLIFFSIVCVAFFAVWMGQRGLLRDSQKTIENIRKIEMDSRNKMVDEILANVEDREGELSELDRRIVDNIRKRRESADGVSVMSIRELSYAFKELLN